MKYPILMVHGMGFRDYKHICYWGRIPKALKKLGAKVYFGEQDSNGSAESNAGQLAVRIDSILSETKAEKLNVIAHSKGGLDVRYLISTLGYADKIASVTTLSTPHNGSRTVDMLTDRLPDGLVRFGCGVSDIWFRLLGDKNPSTYSVVRLFRTDEAKRFNEKNPDREGIYYMSYGFAMKNAASDMTMLIPWLTVSSVEGECDGLLAPEAVRWTNFMGICRGSRRRGISHCDEVDMRRSKLPVCCGGRDYGDITEFYADIFKTLESKGF